MIYIGIDPGKTGALATIQVVHDRAIVRAQPFDESDYMAVLAMCAATCDPVVCALEHVNAMPGQGVTSMFNFGMNFGWIRGVLEANHIPYELVRPQKWKKEFSITQDKNQSIAVCKRLFPDVSLLRTEKCRKDDDGMAEAILLAEYARRKL